LGLGQLGGTTIISGGNTNVQVIHTSFNLGGPFGMPNTISNNAGGNENQTIGSGISTIINNIMQFAGSIGIDPDQPKPTSLEFIQNLTRQKLTEELLETIQIPHCSICQDDYKLDDQLIDLPCKHQFHEDCILPWLNINNSCPTCRHALPPKEDMNNGNNNNGQNPLGGFGGFFSTGR